MAGLQLEAVQSILHLCMGPPRLATTCCGCVNTTGLPEPQPPTAGPATISCLHLPRGRAEQFPWLHSGSLSFFSLLTQRRQARWGPFDLYFLANSTQEKHTTWHNELVG